jgi:hypothetical protein
VPSQSPFVHFAKGRANDTLGWVFLHSLGDFVNDRYEVLQDAQFWLTLEYGLSGWFRTCADSSLRGFWCDGFIPQAASDSKGGVEVKGIAWIGGGRNEQHKCAFTASIPQKMLARRRDEFVVTELTLDLERKDLRLAVAPAKSPNKSLERTREI